jgi:hypothetical protein
VIPLATEFKKEGYNFRQIERGGDVAVFAKSKSPVGAVSFEVVRIRRVPEMEMFGRVIAAHEALPSAEHWGLYGFTYADKVRALRKLRELAQQYPPLSTQKPKPTPVLVGMEVAAA